MKSLVLNCLIAISCLHFVNAQTETLVPFSKNNVYFDASSVFFVNALSVNVERKILSTKKQILNMYARAGLGVLYLPGFESVETKLIGGPVGLSILMGPRAHTFETTLGAFMGYNDYNKSSCWSEDCDFDNRFSAFPMIELAYRYQKPGGGFMFRAKGGTTGIGISLGHSF